MDEMKKMLCHDVEEMNEELFELASFIFDNPEYNYEEYKAAELLTNYLRKQGFTVETGVAGLPTAFRAEWENGTGGPVIGFLGEYDALKDLGHGCGHHLQTPICIGAALAVRKNIQDKPYKLVIYGTPAEETTGGKLIMAKTGCFKELDVAFAYHSAGATRYLLVPRLYSLYMLLFMGNRHMHQNHLNLDGVLLMQWSYHLMD
ncbi:hypothetical protein CULT_590047 [[Clostridium] ultunense Esp]|nr:hypothetical protein CULT_590047 [[Clostridium] ultunense Esp]